MRRVAAALALSCTALAAQESVGHGTVPGRLSQQQEAQRELGRGLASWYGARFHGKPTASGEKYDMHEFTAAHPTLPFGTIVRVRSLVNGRTVDVRINDRGPFIKRRVIDLSRAAAQKLGLIEARTGTKPVVISVQQAPD